MMWLACLYYVFAFIALLYLCFLLGRKYELKKLTEEKDENPYENMETVAIRRKDGSISIQQFPKGYFDKKGKTKAN